MNYAVKKIRFLYAFYRFLSVLIRIGFKWILKLLLYINIYPIGILLFETDS